MKKLIAIPTFDEDGVLDGIEVVDSLYLPDEVTIDGEAIKITGGEVSGLPELPEIIFDVRDVERFMIGGEPKLSPPAAESRVARARLFIRNKLSDYFVNKEKNTAISLR